MRCASEFSSENSYTGQNEQTLWPVLGVWSESAISTWVSECMVSLIQSRHLCWLNSAVQSKEKMEGKTTFSLFKPQVFEGTRQVHLSIVTFNNTYRKRL